jgi:hypothetical protein
MVGWTAVQPHSAGEQCIGRGRPVLEARQSRTHQRPSRTRKARPAIAMLKRPYLADCNCLRFAATALNLMRNVPICSSRACCSTPGGSLRAVSKSLAAIFSRSCILSPLHFAVQNTTGFGEALSVRYRTQWPKASSAGESCVFGNLPCPLNGPQTESTPAAFLESCSGHPTCITDYDLPGYRRVGYARKR